MFLLAMCVALASEPLDGPIEFDDDESGVVVSAVDQALRHEPVAPSRVVAPLELPKPELRSLPSPTRYGRRFGGSDVRGLAAAQGWAWGGRVGSVATLGGLAGAAGLISVTGGRELRLGLPVAIASTGYLGAMVSAGGHTAALRRQGLQVNPNFMLAGLLSGGIGLLTRSGLGIPFLAYGVASPFVQLAANSIVVRQHRRERRLQLGYVTP